MVSTVDEYVNSFDGVKKDWLLTFVNFMRENYPEIPERISYQIPMWKFDKQYVAFSVAKEHFTFHTIDFEMIEELKTLLPGAKFGKGSARISYDDRAAQPVLFDMIRKIISRQRTDQA